MQGGKVNRWGLRGNAPEYGDTYPLSVQRVGEMYVVFSAVIGGALPNHNNYATASQAEAAMNNILGVQ